MSKPGHTARMFLENLNSQGTRDTFAHLQKLAEDLETKPDPEMTEVRLVSSIIDFIEKLSILESNLRSYVKETSQDLPSKKLADLYEEISYDSGSVFRD
jgi:hypothetical protein